jgi:hypothetical protein
VFGAALSDARVLAAAAAIEGVLRSRD